MNAFEKVKAAADAVGLTAFQDRVPKDIPQSFWKNPDDYRKRWITYNMSYEQGVLYGDDDATDLVTGVQVHLFLPDKENFFPWRKQLRDALKEQGFTHPELMLNTLEDDIRHITFECETDEESEE